MATALITGVCSSIGQATAKMFLASGVEVIGLDLKECPVDIEYNPNYLHIICDITRPETLPELNDKCITYVINNAGTDDPCNAIAVNLESLFTIESRYVTKHTKCVVNLCGTSAHFGFGFPQYAASKGGVIAYTINLAKRQARYGGRCVSISPGPVITDADYGIIHDDIKYKAVSDQNLLNRWIEPEEVANAIQFVCTCTCITGIDLMLDCGEHINHTEIF